MERNKFQDTLFSNWKMKTVAGVALIAAACGGASQKHETKISQSSPNQTAPHQEHSSSPIEEVVAGGIVFLTTGALAVRRGFLEQKNQNKSK